MDERDEDIERQRISAVMRYLRRRHGVVYLPIVAIVFVMAWNPRLTFEEALGYWCERGCIHAEWPKDAEERTRAAICRYLLLAGVDTSGGIAAWFNARAREARRIADGISA